MSTTCLLRRSNRPDNPTRTPKRRPALGRDAVFADFRGRDARAIDQGDFVGRRPNDRPRHIGEVAAGVVQDVGDRALRHWLAQAAQAETYEDRAVALEIAGEIARLAGIDIDLPELEAA